jgi:hypothetical protein
MDAHDAERWRRNALRPVTAIAQRVPLMCVSVPRVTREVVGLVLRREAHFVLICILHEPAALDSCLIGYIKIAGVQKGIDSYISRRREHARSEIARSWARLLGRRHKHRATLVVAHDASERSNKPHAHRQATRAAQYLRTSVVAGQYMRHRFRVSP